MTLFETANSGWVNGAAVESESTFLVQNPSTNQTVAEVGNGDVASIHNAITVASKNFGPWSRTAPAERAELLRAWADLIDERAEEIAEIATAESGKLLREARGEVGAGTAALRWSAQMAEDGGRKDLPAPSATREHFTATQPVGVVAAITPWNFPIAAVLVKLGSAVAAGCTVVLKPSEETPLVASALAQLATTAGIPNGVVNVVTTSAPSGFGDVIAERNEVRAVSFTGSTRVGKALYAQCAGTMKRLSLELGGNAPFIVFADADVDRAVADAVNARFYNTGQICVGANRFFVHDAIYDEFAKKLVTQVEALRVGDGMDDSSDLGPLINHRAKDRFMSLLNNATAKGATVLTGGPGPGSDDLFVQPAVLTNVTNEMDIYSQEIFGPMACLYRFTDDDDVVAFANDTNAGLAAYAYSEDHAYLANVGAELEAGVVGLNTTQIFDSALPFGGVKESGLGREHGANCLDEFLDIKSLAFEKGPAIETKGPS